MQPRVRLKQGRKKQQARSQVQPQSNNWGAPALDDWWVHARALAAFSRPHTMLGTLVGVGCVMLMADASVAFSRTGAFALGCALLMNVCIVGFNQVADVRIDVFNKPYLPLASGVWSIRTGAIIAFASGAASLLLASACSSLSSVHLLATLLISLALGIAYSARTPLLRWKRSPSLAAGCILSVRAVLVQCGFFLHAQSKAGIATLTLPPQMLFATGVMAAFSVAIALLKDTPDAAGDKLSDVRTLTVRLGTATVLRISTGLLVAALAGSAVLLCFNCPAGLCCKHWRRITAICTHAALAMSVAASFAAADPTSQASLRAFYMLIWRAFYLEYLSLPLLG